jgi:hypothetical protein
VAILNLIWGLAAVTSSAVFIAILITDLAVWGWIAIGLAAREVLAVLSIWRGGSFGRWSGIAFAAVGVVGPGELRRERGRTTERNRGSSPMTRPASGATLIAWDISCSPICAVTSRGPP